jgi:hypothetical protein
VGMSNDIGLVVHQTSQLHTERVRHVATKAISKFSCMENLEVHLIACMA